MPAFIDFQAVKEAVSFTDAISLLGLKLKHAGNQWRGPCPACRSAGERALVVTEGRGYYCWGVKKGGDVIALASHVLDMPAKAAAQELAERAGIAERNSTGTSTGTSSSRDSSRERGGERDDRSLQPLSYLEHDHDAVHAVGLDPEFCKRHGIGYAPKGVVRGSVAIPFRGEDGTLLGYIGVQELTYLPPEFTPNVVPLKRPA